MSKPPANFGNPADLRALLEATLEALTLPSDIDDYDQRLNARATWARVTLKGALEEAPEDIGWNIAFLRKQIAKEQADAAERAKAGERA